jgi:hypothetical protein
MRNFIIVALSVLVWTGCTGASQGSSEPSSTTHQSFTVEDIDYQITITQQAMEQYRTRAYLLDAKAQSVMSRDFMGYRHAEMLSQQLQGIADDLALHLKQLEEQRAQLLKDRGMKSVQAAPTQP